MDLKEMVSIRRFESIRIIIRTIKSSCECNIEFAGLISHGVSLYSLCSYRMQGTLSINF